jgi:hypothetical protein
LLVTDVLLFHMQRYPVVKQQPHCETNTQQRGGFLYSAYVFFRIHADLRLAISNTFWISDTLASFHHSAVRFNIGRADSAMRDEGLQYPFLTLDR